MFPRFLRSCFVLLILSVVSASAAEVTITRVFTGWREAGSFKRISEYFNGRENTGGTFISRTHPAQRSGFYFLVRALNAGAPFTAKVELEMIVPTQVQTKHYTFAVELKSGTNLINLGLTGPDWPDAEANPVAWKIDLLDADGQTLASEKSYLWEHPVR